jgi:hypothetical protein
LNPPPATKIGEGDQLIVLADNAHDLAAIERDLIAQK